MMMRISLGYAAQKAVLRVVPAQLAAVGLSNTVYKITMGVHENKQGMAAVFPALNQFEPENMARSYQDLDYHPGAVKFDQEESMWPLKPAF